MALLCAYLLASVTAQQQLPKYFKLSLLPSAATENHRRRQVSISLIPPVQQPHYYSFGGGLLIEATEILLIQPQPQPH